MTREQRYRIGRLRTYFEVEYIPDESSREFERTGRDMAKVYLLSRAWSGYELSHLQVRWLDRVWERVFGRESCAVV